MENLAASALASAASSGAVMEWELAAALAGAALASMTIAHTKDRNPDRPSQ
jgi:hypothetical protein